MRPYPEAIDDVEEYEDERWECRQDRDHDSISWNIESTFRHPDVPNYESFRYPGIPNYEFSSSSYAYTDPSDGSHKDHLTFSWAELALHGGGGSGSGSSRSRPPPSRCDWCSRDFGNLDMLASHKVECSASSRVRNLRSMLFQSSNDEDEGPLPPGPTTVPKNLHGSDNTSTMTNPTNIRLCEVMAHSILPLNPNRPQPESLSNKAKSPAAEGPYLLSCPTSELGTDHSTAEELSDRLAPLVLLSEDATSLPGETSLNGSSGEAPNDFNQTDESSDNNNSSSTDYENSSPSDTSMQNLETTRYMSPGEIVTQRKGQVVQSLLIWLNDLLSQKLRDWIQHQDNNSSDRAQSVQCSRGLCHTGPTQDLNKRPRDESCHEEEEEENENREGKAPNHAKRRKDECDTVTRFACPFFKHDKDYFRHPRWSCCWPGWPTVHRVKEHLYRRHILPTHQCVRCRQDFGSLAGLTEHLRLPVRCQLQDQEPPTGIDIEKERRLRAKRTGNGKRSEEEKWIDVFKILFPDEEPIPSPYQGLLFDEIDPGRPQIEGRVLERFEAFSQNEFPRRMRPHIENLVDRALEQTLTPEMLTAAFGHVLQDMFNSFRDSNISPHTALEDPWTISYPRDQQESQSVSEPPISQAPDTALEAEMRRLGALVQQPPEQGLDFDFDEFLLSLGTANAEECNYDIEIGDDKGQATQSA